ncbi:MAG: SDR family NAD(P)-dependent oxidoreductase [Candidatus Ozemobacteraceae bacterium]
MNNNETAHQTPRQKFVNEPIAIVGMSCLFPKAQNLAEYWANIRNKVDAIVEIPKTHWRPEDYFDSDPKKPDCTYSHRGGFLPTIPFDPSEYGISPATIEATDTSQLLGLVVASGAMIDAGYGPGRAFDRDRVSVVLGLTGTLELVIPLGARLGHPIWRRALAKAGVAPDIAEEVVENIGNAYVSWQENSFPGLLGNVAAGRIANRLDLGGTNCVVDAACGSSLSAINLAALELISGRTDMVITGGVDTFNDIFMYMCFSKTPALSPTGDARPFSNNSDGTIIGEGVGMVVLKRLSDAEAAGDNIYAIIKSIGTSSDGKGKAIYAPNATGQEKALRRAYEIAGVDTHSIGMIEAHGTGTKVGDAIEVSALCSVYGKAPEGMPWCGIGSVKSMIGHTKAAAGSGGIIKAAMALKHKVLPPTIKVDQPAPSFAESTSPFYILGEKRPWLRNGDSPRRAGVSSFGFGGSNYHTVLEEYNPKKLAWDWDGNTEFVTLSAPTREALVTALAPFKADLQPLQLHRLAARARHEYAQGGAFRLAFAIESGRTKTLDLIGSIERKLNEQPTPEFFALPEGAYFDRRTAPAGKLALLFPGQGAQYAGMGRDLACLSPEAFESYVEADKAIGAADQAGRRLSDLLFPPTRFDDKAREADEAALRETRNAQPAIGAVAIAGARALEAFGVKPEAVIGHSYGELAALCVAGAYDMAVLYKLSRLRGELMGRGTGDRGGMIAVSMTAENAKRMIAEEKLDLIVANHNAPEQVVLSGATAEIEKAREALKRRKARGTVLQVAGAFHSTLVADAAEPFRKALDGVEIKAPHMSVYANTTASPYPADVKALRDLLGNQLAKPVKFVDSIEKMYADGIRIFVEAGPGARLTGLVKAILGDRPHQVFSLDASSGKRSGSFELAQTLARLVAAGFPVDVKRWQDGEAVLKQESTEKKPRMTVPLCGANYRSPVPEKPAKATKAVQAHQQHAVPAAKAASSQSHSPAPAAHSTPSSHSAEPGAHMQTKQPFGAHPTHTDAGHPAVSGPISPAPATHAVLPGYLQPTYAPDVYPHNGQTHAGFSGGSFEELRMTRETLSTLQQMQQQTADLHRRFLEGQEHAQQSIQRLIERQLSAGMGVSPVTTSLPAMHAIPAMPAYQHIAPMPAPLPAAVATPTPFIPSQVPALEPATPLAKPVATHASSSPIPSPAMTPAPAARASAGPAVAPILLAVVSEKTGYPGEMLNLDMDMEGDLGIDSIKRVEIMSAMQEKMPNAPVIQPDQLGKLRTLGQIIEFLSAGIPSEKSGQAPTAAHSPTPTPASAAKPAAVTTPGIDIVAVLVAIVGEKTGYPPEMLNLQMDMEADLGIDSIKRVEILSAFQERVPNAPVVQPGDLGRFKTLEQIIAYLAEGMPAQAASPAPGAVGSSAAPEGAAGAGFGGIDIVGVLTAIVGEKTGYPPEMLNLQMDMEADLGIDSIKRVEILSAFQERVPNAPVVQPGDLGRFKTLEQIIQYLSAGMTATISATTPTTPATTATTPATTTATSAPAASGVVSGGGFAGIDIVGVLTSIVGEKTGYPPEMLNLQMDMEADLGIDSIKRVEILSAFQERVPDAPVVQPGDLGRFKTLEQIIQYLSAGQSTTSPAPTPSPAHAAPSAHAPTPASPAVAVTLKRTILEAIALEDADRRPVVKLASGSPVLVTDNGTPLGKAIVEALSRRQIAARLIDVHSGTAEAQKGDIAGLVLLAPRMAPEEHTLWNPAAETALKDYFFLLQSLAKNLRVGAIKGGALFATVSRLDGQFGLHGIEAGIDPIQGGLAGLAKTVAREWPEVKAKAIDLDPHWKKDSEAAEALVNELLREGPVEVGLQHKGTTHLVERESQLLEIHEKALWKEGEVVVVTGGARGVTAATAIALAKACKPVMVLFGRSPVPHDEPTWLAPLTSEGEIKKALLAHVPAGTKFTPKQLESEFHSVASNREILATLKKIEDAGGKALYRSVNIRDEQAVRKVLEEVKGSFGPVRGLVHGAGVLRDRLIEEKTREGFEDVFDTKVVGLRNLLNALPSDFLRGVAVFSSVSGRYGRTGQVDYAIANEALNKIARKFAKEHPKCRVASINWGPWDGGMVTGSLKKVFANEGVELIPLEAGARHLVSEMFSTGHAHIEAVVGGRFGSAGAGPENTSSSGSPSGSGSSHGNTGSDQAWSPSTEAVLATAAVAAPADEGIPKKFLKAYERKVSIEHDRFLSSHVINGDPVLPMAMMIEWLAQAALHENPGFHFHGFNGLRVLKGFVLKQGETRTVRAYATKVRGSASLPIVMAELRSGPRDHEIIHGRADIVLAESLPLGESARLSPDCSQAFTETIRKAYDTMLFHGPELEGIKAVEGWSTEGMRLRAEAAPAPETWMREPQRHEWVTDPLVIDSAFQAMILWTHLVCGAPSLPSFAGSYRQFRAGFPRGETRIVMKTVRSSQQMAKADIEFLDAQGGLIGRIEGYECVMNPSLAVAFARRTIEKHAEC